MPEVIHAYSRPSPARNQPFSEFYRTFRLRGRQTPQWAFWQTSALRLHSKLRSPGPSALPVVEYSFPAGGAPGTTVPGPCRVTRCTPSHPPSAYRTVHPRKKKTASTRARPGQARLCRGRAIRFYFPRNGNRCHLPNHVLNPPPSPVSRPPFPVPEIITDIHLVRNSLVPILISSLPPFFPPLPPSSFLPPSCSRFFLVDDLPSSLFFTRRKSFTKLPSLRRRRITSLGSEEEEEKKEDEAAARTLTPFSRVTFIRWWRFFAALFPQKSPTTHGVSWLPATDRQAIKP